eukprot:1011736-Alexandrium_andersonii.AAC.1
MCIRDSHPPHLENLNCAAPEATSNLGPRSSRGVQSASSSHTESEGGGEKRPPTPPRKSAETDT